MLNNAVTTSQSHIASLYQCYAPGLLQYIRRHVPSQEDAEDVLLEVFIAALEKPDLRTMREQEQLAWLRRVAHNKFVDLHRRNIRRSSVPLQDMQYELYDEEHHAPEFVAQSHEQHALLRSHLASLSHTQQEVLRLRFSEDLHCSEIAKRLNKSDGAIRTMLSRILNLLRHAYANSEEEITNG